MLVCTCMNSGGCCLATIEGNIVVAQIERGGGGGRDT